jgi:hypothetical protein
MAIGVSLKEMREVRKGERSGRDHGEGKTESLLRAVPRILTHSSEEGQRV